MHHGSSRLFRTLNGQEKDIGNPDPKLTGPALFENQRLLLSAAARGPKTCRFNYHLLVALFISLTSKANMTGETHEAGMTSRSSVARLSSCTL